MRLKRRQIILWCLTFLALGLGLSIYWSHGRAEREVERYQRQLVAAGEKLSIPELVPAAIPLERNGTGLFQEAAAYLWLRGDLLDTNPPLPMHMAAPGRALIGWQRPDIRDHATNTWEEVQRALQKEDSALQLLEQLVDKPGLDFHLDYTQGASLMLPHLARLKRGAHTLSIAAMCALRHADADAATKQTQAMLALAKGMEHEPLAISQLVRMAIVHMALATQWELLQSTNLNQDRLAEIQMTWMEQQFLQPAEEALAMEHAMAEHMLAQMRQSSAQFRRYADGWASGPSWGNPSVNALEKIAGVAALKALELQWRSAWSYPDELKTLRGDQGLLEAIRLARNQGYFANALRQQKASMAQLGIGIVKDESDVGFAYRQPELKNLFSSSVITLQILIHRVLVAEVARSLAVTALALKRYELRNDHYPSALAQLVPDFVPAVPRDPVDGQPLRYRIHSDGTFLLYSIGEDGADDGGDPSPASDTKSKSFSWQKGRDLVWPRPATPAQQLNETTNGDK